MFNQEKSTMKSKTFSWKSLCVAILVLLGLAIAPPVQAEVSPGELSGEVTGVDLVKHTIQLDGKIVLYVSAGSRLFDREGNRMDLIRLSRMIVQPDENGMRSAELIPFAVYTAVDREGRRTVDELYLREPDH